MSNITKHIMTLLICGAVFLIYGTANAEQSNDNVVASKENGVWDDTKQVSSDVWQGTKEVTSDVWDGTKKVTGDVWNGAKQAGSDIKDAVTDDKNDN